MKRSCRRRGRGAVGSARIEPRVAQGLRPGRGNGRLPVAKLAEDYLAKGAKDLQPGGYMSMRFKVGLFFRPIATGRWHRLSTP